jgi:hypothetical protein
LARVIATRGGLAPPEGPFVIEHREALIYMLCEAAELEHGILCQYLFAAFSLKRRAEEGLTGDELAAVTRWRSQILHVASQEMLHLALVQNLLSAVGAAPPFARPNLPAPARPTTRAGVQLALLPFGEQALQHFMFLERPEGMDLDDAAGLAAVGRAKPKLGEGRHSAAGAGFCDDRASVSVYRGRVRPPVNQTGRGLVVHWPAAGTGKCWPELVAVTDLASSQRAIEEIVEQGEGARGDWRDAHFGQFVEILDEYQQMREARPGFDPVRPVIAANVRPPERDVEVPLITDLLTARVVDLFNVSYEILLQIFQRYFAHTDETDAQLKALADATVGLMVQVIEPLGDLITALPAGPGYEGRTAGPSFELFYESDYLMPHREAAWALLTERLDEAARLCDQLASGNGQPIAGQLRPVFTAMWEISQALAAHLPVASAHRRAAVPNGPQLAESDAVVDPGRPPSAGTAAGEAATPAARLPEPGEPVGFAVHIKPLFRDRDRQSMSFAFDLWSYDDVRTRAGDVLSRLQGGSMPCDGAWSAARVEIFQRWINTGTQP